MSLTINRDVVTRGLFAIAVVVGAAAPAAAEPTATGNPTVSYDSSGTRLMAAYVGADDHVHVLTREAGTWTHTDVTAIAP